MTTGQAREIARLWRDDLPAQVIGELVGLSKATVYTYARDHRDECPARVTKARPERDARAYRMLRKGYRTKEIAEALGVNVRSVRRMAERHERRQGDAV